MPAIRCIVVEDHPLHAEKLLVMLEDMGIEVVATSDNALDGLSLVAEHNPDLLLLDIELKGSFTGTDLAARIRKTNDLPIIFTTSFREAEVRKQAIESRPEAYLLKPIDKDALAAAIDIALSRISTTPEQPAAIRDALFVRVGNMLKKVSIADIVYVEVSAKNYCDLRTAEKRYSIKSSLNEMERVLPGNQFMRVSRSYIVNMNHVEAVHEGNLEILTACEPVALGTAYKAAFLDRLRKL